MDFNDSNARLPRYADSSPSLPTSGERRKPGRPRLSESEIGERKQSVYFGAELLETLKLEAAMRDRSLSWLVSHLCRQGLNGDNQV